jgi:hypothetical protein
MTTNAQLQFADATETNRTWQIPDAETLKIKDDSTYRYAAVAVAFGLLFGVAIAATAGNALSPLAPLNPASVDSRATGLNSPLATPAGQATPLQGRANKLKNTGQGKTTSSASLVAAALKTSAAHKSSAAHRRHAARKGSAGKNSFARRTSEASLKAPATAAVPPASEESRLNDVVPYLFMIEGDATVADFDASRGMIETDEGKTFLIEKTAGESNAGPWQDYHRTVHYRCDQSGNCTISGAGVVVPNAKLT